MLHSESDGPLDEQALDLPAIGNGEDDADDGALDLEVDAIEPDGRDPLDDAVADDVPLEPLIATSADEPSALGDDATGLDQDHADGVQVAETSDALVGSHEDGFEQDDAPLGIETDAGEDDGGAEGVVDPASEAIDELPALDGEN